MKSREGCCGHGIQKVCDYHAGFKDGMAYEQAQSEKFEMDYPRILAQRDALAQALRKIAAHSCQGGFACKMQEETAIAALAALDKPKVQP